MIDDLKADSARWEAERRQQAARNAPSGTLVSKGVKGRPSRQSNSPVLGYRDSATHNARQYHGPTSDSGPGGYPDGRDPFENPRYPGSIAPGYSGNSGGGYQQPASQAQYPASGGYYPNQGSAQPYSQQDPRFAGGSQPAGFGGQQELPYATTGAYSTPARYNDYGPSGGAQASRGIPSSGAPSQGSTYIGSGAPQPAGYGAAGGFYPPAGGNPPFGAPPPVQSQDPLYGRGAYSSKKDPSKRASSDYVASPAGASQAFNAAQGQQQQYQAPPNPRASVPSPSTQQMASSGNAHPSRTRERESADRHHSDRHRPPPRR